MSGIEDRVGYRFRAPELLTEALTHPSRGESRQCRPFNYQRLEFLGDAVLGLCIAEMLCAHFPAEREGDLAKRRAGLVRRETLAEVGRSIGLGPAMLMSEGEAAGGGRENPSNLEDACEALIGAMYLDGGLEAAQAFVRSQWAALLEKETAPPRDAKTSLQEWAQGRGMGLPDYVEEAREGPDHAPVFTVRVTLAGYPPAVASGASKRQAEQGAALALLNTLEQKQ